MNEPGLIPKCLHRISSSMLDKNIDNKLLFKPVGLRKFHTQLN